MLLVYLPYRIQIKFYLILSYLSNLILEVFNSFHIKNFYLNIFLCDYWFLIVLIRDTKVHLVVVYWSKQYSTGVTFIQHVSINIVYQSACSVTYPVGNVIFRAKLLEIRFSKNVL